MSYQLPETREGVDKEIAQIQAELEQSPVLKSKLTYMSKTFAEQGVSVDFMTCLEDIAIAVGVC